ncbi:helix-turn-helix transcriptional regulator [Dactylosporangium aurantiacum]|uniref:Helix-turn-helix transcriptional regulator n=1 Tax=Dactylosporangium aurantiacum TaxID=35754 RepID=A0A9Q9IU56_9ACTN|nr:helix-turn-helix transcriptional regulator [Dactylosporangium aurantiacum]MDG6103747.1 helix-turn-helix transcriptional regulator [Dactylosporangium aurantiacum]UWZ59038.1 helix-turn-helix transcriptional regulator [Dactylosporangium aurantiacum]
MRQGLTGVLSEAAAKLYERLVVSGGLSLVEHPDLDDRPETRELVEKGFARKRYVGAPLLVPVEPARAIDNALMIRQRQLLDQYQLLVRLRDEMHALQQAYRSASPLAPEIDELVQVMTDRAEIGALSVELSLSARTDVMSLETEHFSRPPDPRSARTLPAEVVQRGVRLRNIYSRAALEIDGAREMLQLSVEAGWTCRVYPELPMKLVLVDDRAALLPLGPTGMEGALFVRAPVIVAALRGYFELLWAASVPVDGGAVKLAPEQDQVLRLLLTGMTDAAIARHLGISERTVRRHVGALQEALRVNNRVTLAAAAVREGWV